MRNALFLCASLMLAQPSFAAYSPLPDEPQRIYQDTSTACTITRTGFAHLKQIAAARQTNAQWAEVLKKTTTPAELVWMLGVSQPSALTDGFLGTGRPLEMMVATSATFLKGVAALDDKAGFAMVLVLAQVQGICTE